MAQGLEAVGLVSKTSWVPEGRTCFVIGIECSGAEQILGLVRTRGFSCMARRLAADLCVYIAKHGYAHVGSVTTSTRTRGCKLRFSECS
jgi:hypothetical protein